MHSRFGAVEGTNGVDRQAASAADGEQRRWFASLLEQSCFLARYPQFAAVLARMEPMATAAIPVMAVARHWRADREHGLRLYVNTGYVQQHPEHFAGVLQHEIHHVVCGHLDDARLHRVELPQLMELAMV